MRAMLNRDSVQVIGIADMAEQVSIDKALSAVFR